MTIGIEQINLWLLLPKETQIIEFKEAKNQFDSTKLYKYCVAIANEGGGHLVLGITDKLPRTICGTSAFQDANEVVGKIFSVLGFRVDLNEVTHPDGRIIVFVIPSRPQGTAYQYQGGYWMRSGEQLVAMSEDRLRTIFNEGQPIWLEETAYLNASAQEVVNSLDTQNYFELLNLPYPTNQAGVINRLISDSLIKRTAQGYDISNMAAILLAKSLKRFDTVKRKAIRVILYSGESKLQTISDLTGDKGYAVGFSGLVDYVMSQLPQNEIIENALRKETKLLPKVVLRELLANALIHQDFQISGTSPFVEIYNNRVEITNPGLPLVPVDRFIDSYQSRNESLADLMRRFGICEEKSSGIDRVVETAEFMQLPAPEFLTGHIRTTAIIYGPKAYKDMEGSDRVRACYQHCALQYVLRKQMTNQSLRERFGISSASSNSVSQTINNCVEQNLIKLDPNAPESKRYARYIPSWA
ncbi:ATP-binding protein [Psychrobacter cibarius]|uniref:ATP-binding protein n=2 Tax=Psychrobacter TaxID=497 RepID=UPI001918C3A9|nr:ATP-binding protein [Psychrobacter cibarius]